MLKDAKPRREAPKERKLPRIEVRELPAPAASPPRKSTQQSRTPALFVPESPVPKPRVAPHVPGPSALGYSPQASRDLAEAEAARKFLEMPDLSPLGEVKENARSSLSGDEGAGIVGMLNAFCSEKEMQDRMDWRQLDIFEMAQGSSIERPLLNKTLAVKKYQRSSADKSYPPEQIRTLEACARTMFRLISTTLSNDVSPAKELAELAQNAEYKQVHSFLRDRTRAVRVDLEVQRPWSALTRIYILVHEVCLRFEILSMFLLTFKEEKTYDQKLAHEACSKTMEPLLKAYVLARERAARGEAAYVSPAEPAIRRMCILLLLAGAPDGPTEKGPKEVFSHLHSLPKELLRHPDIVWATKVVTAYAIKDYSLFLRLHAEADFLSACILAPRVGTARLCLLWLMVHQQRPHLLATDKLLLQEMCRRLQIVDLDYGEEFVRFHGLEVIELGTGEKMVLFPGRTKDEKNPWDVRHEGCVAFMKYLATEQMPTETEDFKMDFKRCDALLVKKHGSLEHLPFGRMDIVLGAADHSEKAAVTGLLESSRPATIFSPPKALLLSQASPTKEPIDLTESPKSVVVRTPFKNERASGPEANLFAAFAASPAAEASSKAMTPSRPFLVPVHQQVADQVEPEDDEDEEPEAPPPQKSKRPRPAKLGKALRRPPAREIEDAASSPALQSIAPTRPPPVFGGETGLFQLPPAEQAVSQPESLPPPKPSKVDSAASIFGAALPPSTSRSTALVEKTPPLQLAPVTVPTPVAAPGGKVGAEAAAYLFRVGRVFLAWRALQREWKTWSSWAQNSLPHPPETLPQTPATSSTSLVAARPAARPVSLRAALQEAQYPTPKQCSLCAHRLALLVPPAGTSKVGSLAGLARAVSSAFLPALEKPPECRPLSSSSSWAVSLLQRDEQEARHGGRAGLSILELQPKSLDKAGTLSLGPISAVLHVVDTAISSRAAPGVHGFGALVGQVSSIDSSNICWKDEALRALAAAKAIKASSGRWPSVAVLFAAQVPAHRAQEVGDVARGVAQELAEKVMEQFSSALKALMLPDEALRIWAFCVGLSRHRKDTKSSGFTIITRCLQRACAWAMCAGAGPCLLPEVANLELGRRLVRHWAQRSLETLGGLAFPATAHQLRLDFEAAIDACAADLQRLADDLVLEAPEWLPSSGPTQVEEVFAARQLLWSLEPPLKVWQCCTSPQSFWTVLERFAQDALAKAPKVPRPSWWLEEEPRWSAEVLKAVVCTPLQLAAETWPVAKPLFACSSALPSEAGEDLAVEGVVDAHCILDRPDERSTGVPDLVRTGGPATEEFPAEGPVEATPQAPKRKLEMSEMPERLSKRRRSTFADLLRLDAAWSDSLLKGVALLAANVPLGA